MLLRFQLSDRAHVTTVSAAGEVLAVQGVRADGGVQLVVATREGVARFAIADDATTRVLGRWSGPLAGAVAAGGRLYGWTHGRDVVDLSGATGLGVDAPGSDETPERIRAFLGEGAHHVATSPRGFIGAAGNRVSVGSSAKGRILEVAGEVIHARSGSVTTISRQGFRTYRVGPGQELELATLSASMTADALTATAGRWIAEPGGAPDEVKLLVVVAERTS